MSDYNHLLQSMHWLHAVNTERLWHEQIIPTMLSLVSSISSLHQINNTSSSSSSLGIEVDVRYSQKYHKPVLAHDPIVNDDDELSLSQQPPLLEKFVDHLLHAVGTNQNLFIASRNNDDVNTTTASTRTSTRRLELVVLKLDIKDHEAASFLAAAGGNDEEEQRSLQNKLLLLKSRFISLTSCALQIWFNVDVLPITTSLLTPSQLFESSTTEWSSIIQQAVTTNMFDVFSLGWSGCGRDDVVSYNLDCCEKMRQFVFESILLLLAADNSECFATNSVLLPRISFAVRSSFIKNDRQAQRCLMELIQRVEEKMMYIAPSSLLSSSLQGPLCFLTFWRGRKEKIEEEDWEVARGVFKDHFTVDVS